MAYYFPMSATEFRIGLAVIGHSQAAFGRMLELSPRTVRAWALEETPIPSYAAVILRLLVSKKITVEEVRYVLATPLAMR
jgi:DNA-binding transcriptional regulator YiaG